MPSAARPEEKNLDELERLMVLAASNDRAAQVEYGRRAIEAVPHLIRWLREAWARESSGGLPPPTEPYDCPECGAHYPAIVARPDQRSG